MANSDRLTLPALLDRHLAERPDAPACIDGEKRITYAEFDALCRKTAAWLAAQGVRPGDRIAVWLVNRIEWLALLFGLARIGAALVAVNTRFRAAELEHVLRRSGARMLVIEPTFKKIDFAAILAEVDVAAAQSLEKVAVIRAGSAVPQGVLGKPTVVFDAFERSLSAATDRLSRACGRTRLRARGGGPPGAGRDPVLRRVRLRPHARRIGGGRSRG